jgi:hypothetical protein
MKSPSICGEEHFSRLNTLKMASVDAGTRRSENERVAGIHGVLHQSLWIRVMSWKMVTCSHMKFIIIYIRIYVID